MPDFHFNIVPTFSLLASDDTGVMEQRLLVASRKVPVGVLIPALFRDLSSDAMKNIIEILLGINYLKRVYIALDQADEAEYTQAKKIVAPLKDKVTLIWNDSPELKQVIAEIEEQLPLGPRGKGRAVWTALGYIIGKNEVAAIAFHDADITTYNKDFLSRLIFPVMCMGFQFSKGYYIRYGTKFYGRVTRLFYYPLIRTLKDIFGTTNFLDYLGDFRYPLSGEFATFISQAKLLRYPSDWGIEVGLLSEIYRIVRISQVCQVELVERYDHKHQDVGSGRDKGLNKMATDIARTFFSHLSSNGVILTHEMLSTIRLTYLKHARDSVSIYESFAEMYSDKISFDFHEELTIVESFAKTIETASVDFYQHFYGSPLLPAWKRVDVAVAGIIQKLILAVESY
jgi:glucosyl-3-phosphoglycerate synthase